MHLCIDVGIKNLAVCMGNQDGIAHWSIINLTNVEETAAAVCVTCGKPAKACAPELGLVCGRHVPKGAVWVNEEKTSPTVAQLKTFLASVGVPTKGNRDQLVELARTKAVFPLPKVKNATSFASNTTTVHDAIRAWITRDWEVLKHVTHLYIEHQPVYKNPVMKTVQILVFASLRERYLAAGLPITCAFVHAGKKVKVEQAGDDGYKDRKLAGMDRARAFLTTISDGARWTAHLDTFKKKDDLCDTLCMLLDVLKVEK